MNEPETSKGGDRRRGQVHITVNRQDIEIDGPGDSGLEIKEAAIEQGVDIALDFQLAMLDPEGKQKIIGDNDVVEVSDKSEFFATASDDNSYWEHGL
ncbi:multiubiquitin domain-containing protein [Candidatus Poriferisocius sp.]|uniref:multiubiquitin domain-containing protein n=1 Tax=Candidatus Poriferisocius sp. TaxID=3101276 RepID=UPI003B01A907